MVWKIAFRNLLGDRRRTSILALSLVFAALVGILGNTIVGSLESNINRGLRSGLLGDLQAVDGDRQSIDVTEEPAADAPLISVTGAAERLLLSDPSVRAVAPRLRIAGLLMSEENEAPGIIIGIDPAKESATCPGSDPAMLHLLTAGKIILGPGIATRLGLSAGDEVTLLVNTPDGLFEGDVLAVAGAYAPAGLPLFGEMLAFMPLAELQEMLGLSDEAGSIAIALEPGSDLDRTRQRLQQAVRSEGLRIVSWVEAAGPLVDIGRIGMLGVAFTNSLLWLVIALGVGNTFLIIILERRRQLGTMMALGTSRRRVLGIVLAESACISAASAMAGVLLALAICLSLSAVGVPLFSRAMMFAFGGERFFPIIVWSHFATGFCVVALLGPLGALLPAFVASRTDPILALRAK
jgi:putative ABC transport system permease protein